MQPGFEGRQPRQLPVYLVIWSGGGEKALSYRQQSCTTARHWWCPWCGKRRLHTCLCHYLTWWHGCLHRCGPAALKSVHGEVMKEEHKVRNWHLQLSSEYTSIHCTFCYIHSYLLIRRGGEHPLLVRVFGEVKGIRNYQLPTVKTGRLDKWQWPEPLHHSKSLWCHLQAKGMIGRFWN